MKLLDKFRDEVTSTRKTTTQSSQVQCKTLVSANENETLDLNPNKLEKADVLEV